MNTGVAGSSPVLLPLGPLTSPPTPAAPSASPVRSKIFPHTQYFDRPISPLHPPETRSSVGRSIYSGNNTMRITAILCGLALSLASLPAAGQLYIGGHGGGSFAEDSELSHPSFGGADVEAELDTGFAVGGALGMKTLLGLRLEGEVTYRENEIDRFTVNGASARSRGDVDSVSFMANGWWDIPYPGITPYVGGGIGLSEVSVSNFSVGGVNIGSDEDTVFAFQLGGGVAIPIAPRVDLTADYRYFQAEDPEFGNLEAEYRSHNILVGLRFRL